MDAIFNSFLLVAATEMGDKTQLLAFVLATRFKKPWTIFFGIFFATVLNHFLAASVGNLVAHAIDPTYMKWGLGLTFIGFAGWILIPDKDDSERKAGRYGAFVTTVITFFLAEMGDKTQLSTVALAAKYQNIVLVTLGTTLGMMFSDGIAVFFGEKIAKRVSMKWVRYFSASLFVIFGIGIVVGY